MQSGVGQIQEEYLKLADQAQSLFKSIGELLKGADTQTCIEINEAVSEYAKRIPGILSVFGYDQGLSTAETAVRFFERCRDASVFSAERDAYEIFLDQLTDILDRLLREKNGKERKCNCCGEKVYYRPISSYYTVLWEKYGINNRVLETINREEYTCPCCMSCDRDRLIIAFFERLELDRLIHTEKLLQIAPSAAIEHWIYANCPAVTYESTDLYMKNVSFRSDVQDMFMVEDESYDYFVCSHVLEHVQNDRQAMKELYRILKEDGIGLFLVPVYLDDDHIDEAWGLSEEENWRRFGQGDHCRSYVREELAERLQEAGFMVHPVGKDFFGEAVFRECGLTDTSTLYVLTKQRTKLKDFIAEKIKKRDMNLEYPLVSVILPAYNHEEYVAEAIESVLGQTYPNFEFLVADDGSEDRTVDVIMGYEDRIDQIHLFDVNTGCREAMKALLECANGKYIAMMHSDDIWDRKKLMMQVLYLENHPKVDACFTGCQVFTDDGRFMSDVFLAVNKKKEEWFRYFYEHGNCLAHPSLMINTDIYRNLFLNDGFLMFRQLPDFWVWTRLVERAEIHVIEKNLTFFRQHGNGVNQNTSEPTRENLSRHIVEESFIWYDLIRKMDSIYFLDVFADRLIKKNITDEKEIMCEKFFILLNSRKYCRQAAIFYLYEIYQVSGVPELLEQQYGFSNKDIYRIAGEWGIKLVK